MKHADRDIQRARGYLAENAALREAVSAAPDAILEPHYLGVGEHNLNFRFIEPASGRNYVLRVNVASQPFHANQVAYEFAALRALERSGCTPKPVFLDDSPAAPGKGVIVETFCEGEQLDFDHLQPGDVECALALMANVHAVPVSADCPLFRPHDPARALFDECLERFRVYRTSAFEEARLTRWVERFITEAQTLLDASTCTEADCRHIINTETLPSHFLVARDSGSEPLHQHQAVSGSFIDWERPIVGEVAQDVAYFVSPTTTLWDSDWRFPADMADQVAEDYWQAVDGRFARGGFDTRFRLYRALTFLRSTTWFCRALIHYNQDETHKTEKTARKIHAYLSDDFLSSLAAEMQR